MQSYLTIKMAGRVCAQTRNIGPFQMCTRILIPIMDSMCVCVVCGAFWQPMAAHRTEFAQRGPRQHERERERTRQSTNAYTK